MRDFFSVLDMPKFIIVLLLTVVPSILLLALILYSDRKSREPFFMILICVLSGAFTICSALLVDQIIIKFNFIVGDLDIPPTAYSVYKISILAGVEEYVKLLTLYLFLYKNKAYDDIFDGFVYSSIIALSFALIETFLYVAKEGTYSEMTSLAILRNFTAVPLHIVCGIVMGYFTSLEKFSKKSGKRIQNLAFSLLVPTFIHTVYNVFFSMISITDTGSHPGIISIILVFILGIYFVGALFIYKTYKLNKIFIMNDIYPKRFNYLMNKNEFMYKESRRYS